jgi:hypothetical protein
METLTVRQGGFEVLAKDYKGDTVSVKYANRTQAIKKATELGDEWDVYRFMSCWFFVARKVA